MHSCGSHDVRLSDLTSRDAADFLVGIFCTFGNGITQFGNMVKEKKSKCDIICCQSSKAEHLLSLRTTVKKVN